MGTLPPLSHNISHLRLLAELTSISYLPFRLGETRRITRTAYPGAGKPSLMKPLTCFCSSRTHSAAGLTFSEHSYDSVNLPTRKVSRMIEHSDTGASVPRPVQQSV